MSMHGTALSWHTEGPRLFAPALLIRPLPKPDEHYIGYWLRLAHANGLDKPMWLRPKVQRRNLPKGTGLARWCPCCLMAADPFWPQLWDGGPAACMEHQCWLCDTCPACSRPTLWHRVRLLSCSCGYDFRETRPEPFSTELVASLVEEDDTDESVMLSAALTVEQRWHLAQFLGALHTYGLEGKPLKKASRSCVKTEMEFVTIGAEILIGGEAAFYELLDCIRVRPTCGVAVQLIGEAFPRFLARLRQHLSQTERDCLLPHIRAYLLASTDSKFPITWRERQLASARADQSHAHCFKIRPKRLSALLTQYGMSPKIRYTSNDRKMLVVGQVELQRVHQGLANPVSAKAAARRFGLSPARQKELVKAGFIDLQGGKAKSTSYSKLLQRIADRAIGQETVFKDGISLRDALRERIPQPLTANFFRLLLNGEITVKILRTEVQHMGDFEVSRQIVMDFLANAKTHRKRYFSIPEAARKLELKQEVLYHLVNHGLIPVTTSTFGRRKSRFIKQIEIERFADRIEPLVRAAARAKVGNRASLEWARKQGLEIVSGPEIDGGRQYFIRCPRLGQSGNAGI